MRAIRRTLYGVGYGGVRRGEKKSLGGSVGPEVSWRIQLGLGGMVEGGRR